MYVCETCKVFGFSSDGLAYGMIDQQLSRSPSLSLSLSLCVCVCVCVNAGGPNHNRYTQTCNPARGSGHAPQTVPPDGHPDIFPDNNFPQRNLLHTKPPPNTRTPPSQNYPPKNGSRASERWACCSVTCLASTICVLVFDVGSGGVGSGEVASCVGLGP